MNALLEEARKSWDYVVSNKIVYRGEVSEPNLKPIAKATDWLPKYDLRLNWIYLNFVLVGNVKPQFEAVIELASPMETGSVNRDLGVTRSNGDNYVLIRDAQFVKQIQGMRLTARPSVIRLKRFDDPSSRRQNILHGVAQSFEGSRVSNREGCGISSSAW